jgi:hypothetical protein
MAERDNSNSSPGDSLAGERLSRVGLDRFTVGIAVGALALVVILLAVILARPDETRPMDESRPAGVVHNYYLARMNDDLMAAYAYLSAEAQARTPYGSFAAGRRPSSSPKARIRIDDERIEGDTARVTVRSSSTGGGFLPFTPGEFTNEQTLVLRRENEAWKLTQAPFGPP